MTWTSMQQKVFVGPDVEDQCQAYGHYDTTNKACVCTTECPNNMVPLPACIVSADFFIACGCSQ